MTRVKVLIFAFGFLTVFLTSAFAMEDDAEGSAAEDKARRAHEKASSDMIYQNEEWKALYYQNVRIIQLLKEIRDSIESMRSRDGAKTAEEKTA